MAPDWRQLLVMELARTAREGLDSWSCAIRFPAPGASGGGLGGTVSFGSIASLSAPRGRRDTRHYGNCQLGAAWPGQPGCAAARRNLRHVGNRSATQKMVCKGDLCIYAVHGDPMTWFTSRLYVLGGPYDREVYP